MNVRGPLSKQLDRRWLATSLLLLSMIPLLSIYTRGVWAIAMPTLLLAVILLGQARRYGYRLSRCAAVRPAYSVISVNHSTCAAIRPQTDSTHR